MLENEYGRYRFKILAELHSDVCSRYASPVEVNAFAAIAERNKHYVLSNEICRQCNGKQQRKIRGGRSVKLPDLFMFRTLRHIFARIRTYQVLRTTKYISRGKKKKPRRSGLGMDMWNVGTKSAESISLKRRGYLFFSENTCILRSCSYRLGFGAGSIV